MGWESNTVFQLLIIQGSVGSGLFVYSPTPGAGNLIDSIVAVSGSDNFTNSAIQGIFNYLPGPPSQAAGIQNGQLVFYTAATEAGPWTAQAQINLTGGNDLNVQGVGGNVLLSSSLAGKVVLVQGNALQVQATLNASPFQVRNLQAAPTSPIEQIIAAAAADNCLGIQVFGDTINRLRIDSNGKIQWGPGGAGAVDTDLFRGAAGVLQTDSTLAITNQATPGTLPGAAQLYAASGQPAYKNPQGLTANLSGGQLAAVNVNTVTGTAFANLASATIPAADAVVGAVYKITAIGNGTWGSTQQQLNLGARFGAAAANVVAQASINLAAFAASAAFTWVAEVVAVCVTTGATGTWIVLINGTATQTANPILPGSGTTNTVPFAIATAAPITLDTTVAEVLGISASWGSTTGAPTISKQSSFFERIA